MALIVASGQVALSPITVGSGSKAPKCLFQPPSSPLLLVTEAWFSAGHSETQNKIYFPVSLSLVLAYDICAEVINGKAA